MIVTQRVKTFWAESGTVKRILTVIALLAALTQLAAIITGFVNWLHTPVQLLLGQELRAMGVPQQLDTLGQRVTKLEERAATLKQLDSAMQLIGKGMHEQALEIREVKTQTGMILDEVRRTK